MLIFWRLLLGHLVADFTLQTDFVAEWKRKSRWGMLFHCVTHPVMYVILCRPYLGDYWIDSPALRIKGWVCVLLIFLLHYAEDSWRVAMIARKKFRDGLAFFTWDQAFHLFCLAALAPPGAAGRTGDFAPEAWVALGCLAVVVTHFFTTALYFVEKDLFRAAYPCADEKYYTMVERFVLAICFLLPGLWAPAVAAGWVLGAAYVRAARQLDFSWFGFYGGGLCSVACGLAARCFWR